ncbi:DUF4102 domain-containing protein [Rhodovarius crocodyli]|uniref:DUF4102 domain-containing protein n=1 Tax=Rhodovarius crocodyli TaxID=1979269 RepID=A0A437MJA5_9PROT|nr:tyrosine-type recombinase/integrase [Rhodovarius crocodyli]RVT97675.1 DUF4102 domain-containing protein [Rhodovarius crocodyli]
MAIKVQSEGPVRITRTSIEGAWKRRATGVRTVIRDMECRGLALVVNPTAMSWVYSYKPRGMDPLTGKRFPTRSLMIGTPASHSPEDARLEANKTKGSLATGGDPAGQRKAAHRANAVKIAATVDRLVEIYAEALPHRPKMRGRGTPGAAYVATELAHLRAAVETMKAGDKAVRDVSAPDLRTLLRAEAKRPAVARHRFGAVSRFLDWCMDDGHAPSNVCLSIGKDKRPKPAAPRTRHLTPDQAAIIWKAAEGMDHGVHRDFARFLLVVPCRRIEAARMDWRHVDLDGAIWTQAGKMTKNGEPHRLHLPALVLDILRQRHEAAGKPKTGLVFKAPVSDNPLSTFSAINAKLDELSGFDDWAWHDLRRTFATGVAEVGVSESVADAMLNHKQSATRGGVMGGYQYAVRWPERVAAMEAWASSLAAAIEGKPQPSNVVRLLPRNAS